MKFALNALASDCNARCGSLETAHGTIQTPVFMPVGTQGTVKTLSPDELLDVGSQIILGNTYHLYLRPGHQLVEEAGGLHRFMAWERPILTDSGGFQVYSLARLRRISDERVVFQSHHDGSYHEFSPEHAIDVQMSLGSDVMMVLDECPPYPCDERYAAESVERTTVWAKRCLTRYGQTDPVHGFEPSLFAIVQGSTFPELRKRSAQALIDLDFEGYAIGGLSIGEPKAILFEMVQTCTELLPKDRPRYLMGMGKPEDLVEGVVAGIDMFDCVIPTRNARKGQVFTWNGTVTVKNAAYKRDFSPIDETCSCYTCSKFSRAYLRHLFQAEELLGMRLASIHNLYFYHQLIAQMREAIQADTLLAWKERFLKTYAGLSSL